MTLTLHSDGKPVTDADVTLDLSMPAMEMPDNRPTVIEIEDGLYRAEAIFTMRGVWRIQVDVNRTDSHATFTFDLMTK